MSPGLPPPTQQTVNSIGRKGKGLLLGPDARTWRPSPYTCPSFPQADAHLGKSQLEAEEDSLGLNINQTPRCPSPTVLSLQPSFQFLPVSFASRNFGSVVLAGATHLLPSIVPGTKEVLN